MRNAILPLGCVVLAGCAAPFFADVNSYRDNTDHPGTRYVIVSAIKDVGEGDLQFREAAGYLERALASKGYIRVEEPAGADLAVCMLYGIGDPTEQYYSFSSPVWGQTGGGTSSFTAHTVGTFGSSRTTGTVTQQPTYGVVGYQSAVGSYTSFTRFLSVTAIDLRVFADKKEIKEVWKTEVTSTGSSGDLRRVLPILVAASQPYLATNTRKSVPVRLTEGSKSVLAIKEPIKPE